MGAIVGDTELQAGIIMTETDQEGVQPQHYGKEQLEKMVLQLIHENNLLRGHLQQARATLLQKDGLILEWIAATKGWKAVSIALREEGQATQDRDRHPLAYDSAKRCRIYREARRAEHARLQGQLYPPTSWRPK